MKILIVGGSGFIGPFIARQLQQQGHTVAVFSRRAAAISPGVLHIRGDRNQLDEHLAAIRQFAPEVVIDLILSSGRQARILMETLRGTTRRVVAASSGDVYRAAGILHGTEPGPLQAVPLSETSELRTQLNVYPRQTLEMLKSTFAWLDNEYDKIPVEQEVAGAADPDGIVLRLPMVYGPGDPLHRMHAQIKRMDDERPVIMLPDDLASWRAPRGYVENVAAALVLAATAERVPSKIYNVAELEAYSEVEWARKVAGVAQWQGEIVVLPRERTPKHLLGPGNFAQHWIMSSELIRRELGYKECIDSEEAIRRTMAWERAHPPAQFDRSLFDYAAEDAAARAMPA
jgi:nucleoside-diphosphate-sugar epimerase